MQLRPDGSAGDVDYGVIGRDYASFRRPDRRIAAFLESHLGEAAQILNVGAGAGSYEPADRQVTAVEPSAAMRAQRPPYLATAIDAVAEHLPFPDRHFDAAMAIFTVHQWKDVAAGLHEMRRVTRGPALILTCDPAQVRDFWLNDYAPEVLAQEARRYPSFEALRAGLGGMVETVPVPIPLDCSDGFNEAYYGRPEMFLDAGARQACSAWSFVAPERAAAAVDRLRADLADGRWDRAYGHLRSRPQYRGSLYLVISGG